LAGVEGRRRRQQRKRFRRRRRRRRRRIGNKSHSSAGQLKIRGMKNTEQKSCSVL
jgi:hypothetical protein